MIFPQSFCRDYVKIQGGLGNQLYQLSYAHHLKHRCGRRHVHIYFLSSKKRQGDARDRTKRNYLTTLYADLGMATSKASRLLCGAIIKLTHIFPFLSRGLFKGLYEPHQKHGVYLSDDMLRNVNGGGYFIQLHVGYYQSCKYLDADFTAKIYRSLASTNPNKLFTPSTSDVVIHLRRGDFLDEEVRHIYRFFDITHYLQGLELLSREQAIGKVYVFSDSFQAIQDDLRSLSRYYELVCVEDNTVVGDIVQMAQFSRFVLANSTFSWWAAFMAETQREVRVVVPERPLCYSNEEDSFYPPHWTTI